jgi:hypothetical protein
MEKCDEHRRAGRLAAVVIDVAMVIALVAAMIYGIVRVASRSAQ